MIHRDQRGYALIFAMGLIFISTVIGLAYMKMGTLESGLVTDAESWTQAMDTSDAAVQGTLELVRSSQVSPFYPTGISRTTNKPEWGNWSQQNYIDRSWSSSSQGSTSSTYGIHDASVSDLLNLDRFRDGEYTWTASYDKPNAPSGYTENTKFFLSTVGDQPIADRPEASRRITTFASLPAGLGLDRVEVSGSSIIDNTPCLVDPSLTLPNVTFDLGPFIVSGGQVSSAVAAELYNGEASVKLDAQNGNVVYDGATYDPPAISTQMTLCQNANALFQVLSQTGVLQLVPLGSPIQSFASLIVGGGSSTSAGVTQALPPGLFRSDSTINPYYFMGRSAAESPGIAEYQGDQTFRPGSFSGPGTYPVRASGSAAIDGGNLAEPYRPRGNIVLVHGNVNLFGGWQDLEKAWGPLTDVTGRARPIDIVIAADGDINVDGPTEGFSHVNTGKNTRLVLIAGNDIIFTGDLFMTRLNVVAVAHRDIRLLQRTLPDGTPLATSVLGKTGISIPNAAALPLLMSSLSGTLVAGRNIEHTAGWDLAFSEDVVNGNMSAEPVPQVVIGDFTSGPDGFAATENPSPAGDGEDLLNPESVVAGGDDSLTITVTPGEDVTAPSPIVPTVTLIKISHPITGEQMTVPIEGHPTIPAVPATPLTPAMPAQPEEYYVTISGIRIDVLPGQKVANPFTNAATTPNYLLKNGSQGEAIVKTYLVPADWSGHESLSVTYRSTLEDQDVLNAQGLELPPLLGSVLPGASLMIEDILGRRLVLPLTYSDGFRTEEIDLRQGFTGEQVSVVDPRNPSLAAYGYSNFDLSKVAKVSVRINHAKAVAGASPLVALSNVTLPGNAGAGHNLPFPFHLELMNWQAMANR